MRVAHVVAVHVAHQDDVDLAEPRIVCAGDGAAGVVEDARAVRVLEDECAVLRTELAVDPPERRHLDALRGSGKGQGNAGKSHPDHARTKHGSILIVETRQVTILASIKATPGGKGQRSE